VNLREKVEGISSRVAGNVFCNMSIRCDMSSSNAKMEQEVHNAMRVVLVHEKLKNMNRLQNYIWNNGSCGSFDWHEDAKVGDVVLGGLVGAISWNNQASSPFFEIDFGAGSPLRGVVWNWQVTVLKNPRDGGLDVYIDKSSRGHGTWKQPPRKWLVRRNYLFLGGMGSAVALVKVGLKWHNIPLALLSGTMLALAGKAGRRARVEAELSAKEFYDAVETNAHSFNILQTVAT
jgi:hypothetical protein